MNPSISTPKALNPSADPTLMHLKILLPFEVLLERDDVTRIVTETDQGSLGILPRRLDCTARLIAGILGYQTTAEEMVYLAVSGGILVKYGKEVLVSVNRATAGVSLGKLHEAVRKDFAQVGERQKKVRSVMAKLESGFIKRFMEMRRG